MGGFAVSLLVCVPGKVVPARPQCRSSRAAVEAGMEDGGPFSRFFVGRSKRKEQISNGMLTFQRAWPDPTHRSRFLPAKNVLLTQRQVGRSMILSFRDERRGALRRRWAACDDAGQPDQRLDGQIEAKREVKE